MDSQGAAVIFHMMKSMSEKALTEGEDGHTITCKVH